MCVCMFESEMLIRVNRHNLPVRALQDSLLAKSGSCTKSEFRFSSRESVSSRYREDKSWISTSLITTQAFLHLLR